MVAPFAYPKNPWSLVFAFIVRFLTVNPCPSKLPLNGLAEVPIADHVIAF